MFIFVVTVIVIVLIVAFLVWSAKKKANNEKLGERGPIKQ